MIVFLSWWAVYLCGFYQGKRFEGYKIQRVVDGDTLTVINQRDNREVRLRFWGINAPDVNECYTEEARILLARLLGSSVPRLEVKGYDGYGRILANVFVDKDDLSQKMVELGAAKVYDAATVHDDLKPDQEYLTKLRKLEDIARNKKLGLWAECVGK